jgi:hypothetical protein
MKAPKYSAVVIKNDNGTVTVKQFASSTTAKIAYKTAITAGLDAYFYYIPLKSKTTVSETNPIEVTI